MDLFFAGVGFSGAILISASYAMALADKATHYPSGFLWLNLIGGLALCFPAYLADAVVTHVLNSFWIFIAIAGLAGHYSNGGWNAPLSVNAVVAAIAIVLVIYLGMPELEAERNEHWWAGMGGMMAMLCFMGGYFIITQFVSTTWALPAYLCLSMCGNVLYAPLLLHADNTPTLALQGFCFCAGFIKLVLMICSRLKTPLETTA
jgi:hypothetical protein